MAQEAQFAIGARDPAEDRELVEGRGEGSAVPVVRPGRRGAMGMRDGEIGRVEGLLADPGGHRVTHVLLREGHLWGPVDINHSG